MYNFFKGFNKKANQNFYNFTVSLKQQFHTLCSNFLKTYKYYNQEKKKSNKMWEMLAW